MNVHIDPPPLQITHVHPSPDELARRPAEHVTWDVPVDRMLVYSRSLLTSYVRGLHQQGMLQDTARVFMRGTMAFGVVFFIGSDPNSWLLLPLTGWPLTGSARAA